MAKTLVIPVDDDTNAWVLKSKKEMKSKSVAEFLRALIQHFRSTSEITELKKKMEKAQIESMLQEASAKAEEAARRKEQLEKQLEKLGA